MLRLTQVYRGYQALYDYIKNFGIDFNTKCLVKIFTSSMDKEQSVDVAKKVKEILPNSIIVGASSALAIIYNGQALEDETFIMIDIFEKLEINRTIFTYENKTPQQLAEEIHSVHCEIKSRETAVVGIIMSYGYSNVEAFLNAINDLSPFLSLTGAISGPIISKNITGFVFTDDGVIENGIITFCANGSEIRNFVKTVTTVDTINDEIFEITGVNTEFVETIDNKPALEWMMNYLDITHDDLLDTPDYNELIKNDYLIHFPFIMQNSDNCARFTKWDSKLDKLSIHHATVKRGDKFKMGYVNPNKVLKESYELCEEALDTPIEHLFVYSCFLRQLYMKNGLEWELSPFDKYNVCGIFVGGEIACSDEKNYFYASARTIQGIAENEKYLIPNMTALENIPAKIDSEIEESKGKILLKTKFNVLNDDNEVDKIQKHIDIHFDLPNIYQYEDDVVIKKYNKIALVEILTADATIAFAGQDTYYIACRDILKDVKQFVIEQGLNKLISFYTLNYKTLLIACSDKVDNEEFRKYMSIIHEQFEYPTSKETEISGVVRFALVIGGGNDMIDIGIDTLLINKNSQDNFIVCDRNFTKDISISEETKVIDLLNRAVNKKLIVPFYQGIRNNITGKIDKYEALMRIIDENGVTYSPFVFLNIAKKYKFYNKISQMMIEQVFNDFMEREESVSINISLYDIQSANFRKWLMNKLATYPHPNRIIIEFVETENYQEINLLFDFVNQIRAMGSNIAVDDFGAGYSTFSTIVALNPDFIKIDGSIIGKLVQSEDNVVILNSIKYLAEQMGAQIVAEFVENQQIQSILEEHHVNHSQGYHFSKPMPLNQIDKRD